MSPHAIPTAVLGLLFLLIWLALISLPGLALTYIRWRLSRALQPIWARAVLRATLIALLLTPTIYGHAGPVPALLIVLGGNGKEKFVGILSPDSRGVDHRCSGGGYLRKEGRASPVGAGVAGFNSQKLRFARPFGHRVVKSKWQASADRKLGGPRYPFYGCCLPLCVGLRARRALQGSPARARQVLVSKYTD